MVVKGRKARLTNSMRDRGKRRVMTVVACSPVQADVAPNHHQQQKPFTNMGSTVRSFPKRNAVSVRGGRKKGKKSSTRPRGTPPSTPAAPVRCACSHSDAAVFPH